MPAGGSGQLDEEMTRFGWFSTRGTIDLIYGCQAAERWQNAFASAGIDPRLLVSGGGTA